MTSGEILRTEREKQGLTIADMARRTYIAEMYLRALEDGDDDVIPGAVYGKGWLRNYGEALGLSGPAMLELWNEEHRTRHAPTVVTGVMRTERSYLTSPERVEMVGRKRRRRVRSAPRSLTVRILQVLAWAIVAGTVVWIFWL